MIKFVKKNKLQYRNGLIVDKKGRVVALDDAIVDQLNMLETKVQQHAYIKAQPEATPVPSLDGFKRESIHDNSGIEVAAIDTPIMDKRIEEGLAFAKEAERTYKADEANRIINQHLKSLVEFVINDEVLVDCDAGYAHEIDTPTLGNPLELTDGDIVSAVLFTLGVDADLTESKED